MATSWTYYNWNTLAIGSSARQTALSLHIKEVSQKLADTFNVQGKSHNPALERYLDRLMAAMSEEFGSSSPADATTSQQASFVRLRASKR